MLSVNSSTVRLAWSQPLIPNGPVPPSYNVSRAFSALHLPPPIVTAGVHFPGLGYYKFPSGVVPASAINDIELSFRTQYASGLLLFLASDGPQTDMLSVELRDGKPWFVFDSQEGAAAFTLVESVRFDDGKWHRLRIHREKQKGTLFVDSYQASQNSPGISTVIGNNTGVYFGGLPASFKIVRSDTDYARLERYSFIGCLTGITSGGRQLDWSSALDAVGVEPERNGCPARDAKKAIFLRGRGFAAFNTNIFSSSIFSFSLYFRTQLLSGILLFARGPTSTFAIQFENNTVEIKVSTSSTQIFVSVSSPSVLCDGQWHNLTLTNFGQNRLNIRLDHMGTSSSGITNLQITSNIFIGGVPWASPAEALARQFGVNVDSPFGGCIRVLSAALEIDYVRSVTALLNSDLDGCMPESTIPASTEFGTCLPFTSSVVYSGKMEGFDDSTVDTFTGKLHQLVVHNMSFSALSSVS